MMGSLALGAPLAAQAADGEAWWSGDWYLKVGATGFVMPRYEGSKSHLLGVTPLISLGKAGNTVRFSSPTDNPSFALFDNGPIRAGIVGKLITSRNADDSDDLRGLKPVKWGVEAGGFVEAYPTDWMRVRAEVRHGIRSYGGVVADLSADAFMDVTPTIRVSAGPRLSFASNDYVDAYYKVDTRHSLKSGLKKYDPDGGLISAGLGAAINWKATEKIEAGAFASYDRLTGDVADSSLVQQRGSKNQYTIGLYSTYRFGFTLP